MENLKENSLVSVIIPAYNHEKYIHETIESIINQTYRNIELIILDDGSKDSTWDKIQEIKDKCEKRFARIHFETKENEGTCKTLNKLIYLAKGEFIYLIASDDIAKPDAIELEVKFLSKNKDYALCVGDNEYIDVESKPCDIENCKTFVKYYEKAKGFKFTSKKFGQYNTIYSGNYIPNGYMIRKSILEKTGLFTPEAPLEDFYLMLQISKYAKMKYIDKVLFSYRMHDTNTIKNREKMISMQKKTLAHEQNLNNDISVLVKHQGIPFIFEKLKYKKFSKDDYVYHCSKIIKLFSVQIYVQKYVEKM